MTLVKYRNGAPKGFNNLMDDFFATMPSLMGEGYSNTGWKHFPAVNVTETEGGFEMALLAPGFEKEQFAVSLDDKVLTISAEQKKEENAEGGKTVRREFELKSFKRSFSIDEQIDADGISAKYVNGVLTVNLPRKKDVKEAKKQITIA